MITLTISDRLVKALCDTLLYSLWEGLSLAAVAGLIVICTRKASSGLRYNLLVSALILFALGAPVTFSLQYFKSSDAPPAQTIYRSADATGMTAAGPVAPAGTMPLPDFTHRASAWLNDHRNTIVLVWFLIICIRSLQLGVGLYGTDRLKRVRVFSVKDHWPERMQQLARSLGIRQKIDLLESGLAKAPMMIGYLKPVILVPVGLLTALSPAEIEAILIHELAHIKRRDYMVNLLQNLLEIVFFFNPAVLWVSTMVRTERENCCDDLVLAHDKNKTTYIRALVSCEEFQSSVSPYAMAFSGRRNTLLHRVRRLVNNRNHSLNLLEKTILTLCLIGAGLFVTAFSAKEAAPAHLKSAISSPLLHPGKTIVPNPRATTAIARPMPKAVNKQEAKPVQEAKPKHDTTGVPVVPDLGDTLIKYYIIGAKFDMTVKLNSSELLINGVKQPESVRALIYSKFLNNGQTVDIDYVYKKTEDNPYSPPYSPYSHPSNGGNYNDQRQQNLDRERQNLEREQQAIEREQQNLDREQLALNREKKYLAQNQKYRPEYNYAEAAIKADLMKDELVSDTNHIHFTINEKEFILNGVTQSPEVHQRYMEKYCPARGAAGWSWSHSTGMPDRKVN